MAGFENTIVFSNGEKLQPSSSDDITRMQTLSTDIARINFTGNPNGNVAANPGSLCHDPVSGNVYYKSIGTDDNGWAQFGNISLSGSGAQFFIPVFSDNTGFLIQASAWEINSSGQMISPATGSNSQPDLCLAGTTTGMYKRGTGQVGFSSVGTEVGFYDNTEFQWNATIKSFVTDSNTNSATVSLQSQHALNGGGLGADGIGTRWRSSLTDSSGSVHTAADLVSEYQVANSGTRKARWRFFCDSAGSLTETFNTGLYQSQFFSGMAINRTATATDYSVLPSDYLIAVTNTSAARTITLPAPNATGMVPGQVFEIKDESLAASVNNITITPASGTIDGLSSQIIDVNGGSLTVYSNGTNYFIK